MTPRFWDDLARRAAAIYAQKGSLKTIPAILRVPVHVKSKVDNDPEYLSRGGRGSKHMRKPILRAAALARAEERRRIEIQSYVDELLVEVGPKD